MLPEPQRVGGGVRPVGMIAFEYDRLILRVQILVRVLLVLFQIQVLMYA